MCSITDGRPEYQLILECSCPISNATRWAWFKCYQITICSESAPVNQAISILFILQLYFVILFQYKSLLLWLLCVWRPKKHLQLTIWPMCSHVQYFLPIDLCMHSVNKVPCNKCLLKNCGNKCVSICFKRCDCHHCQITWI